MADLYIRAGHPDYAVPRQLTELLCVGFLVSVWWRNGHVLKWKKDQRYDRTAQRLVLWQFNLISSLIAFHVISFLVSFIVVLNKSFVGVFFKQKISGFLRKNSNRRTVLSNYTLSLVGLMFIH